MTTRAVEQFDEWESSPFRDGYRGLHDLADGEFSGIVQAGHAKLCMLNGTVVGVLDGDIGDFEDATGTAHEAPSPALPLLALMQERNDEVRAKYYSEDTPLSEVDDTLADGGFTGFVELSENVLSGDYYVVYHRGRSMAVAWVGNAGQLLTDDEAFDRADGEVGIFHVRPAEIDAIEIPAVEEGDADAADGAEAAGGAALGTEAADEGGGTEADAVDDASGGAGDAAHGEPVTAADDGSGAAADDDSGVAVDDDQAEPGSGGANASDASPGQGASASADERPAGTDGSPSDGREVTETSFDRDDAAGASTDSDEPSRSDDAGESADRTVDRDEAARSGDRRTGSDRRDDGSQTDRTARDRTARSGDAGTDSGPERASGTGRSAGADRRDSRSPSARRSGDRTADARADDPAEERTTDARTDDSGADARAGGRSGAAPTRTDAAESEGRSRETSVGRTGERSGSDAAGVAGESAEGSASSPDQLATHTVPSLDPSRTTSADADDESVDAPPANATVESAPSTAADRSAIDPPDRAAGGGSERSARDGPAAGASDRRRSEEAGRRERADGAASAGGGDRASARVEDLETELAEREATIDDLEAELAAAESEREDLRARLEDVRTERDDLRDQLERAESERDSLESERDSLESTVDDLEAEVAQLESQIDEIEAEFGAAVDADRRLSPGEALDQTDLFVRYESKGKPTLETAHAGEASREDVGENLGLEYHTQFERANVSVGGRPFDEFLRETIQFRFVDWVVNHLLYEIRDTGKVAELRGIYDAIPQIDRVELDGAIATEYTEDGQERRSQESFDVVMRDRMGNALLTANMNDSRQAATESMMSTLVTASSHVGESTATLGASFFVTSSFFEPEALETAAEATSGGLLSRDKRQNFVKLSRKQGYHLCLVEAREDKFHLAVPEL
ncbi:MAG: hypothetical protein ABEJ26_03450 [Halosimplex sp.]